VLEIEIQFLDVGNHLIAATFDDDPGGKGLAVGENQLSF
jgi:hypothetical protein